MKEKYKGSNKKLKISDFNTQEDSQNFNKKTGSSGIV